MSTTSFWGISTTAWTALTALGTLALAAATVAAVLVSLSSVKKARERDDNLRRQDREHEAELRRQDAAEWEKRRLEEQRNREEYEAREVTISVEADLPQTSPDSRFHRLVTVSTPAIYPIRQVTVQWAGTAGSGLSIQPLGHGGDTPVEESGRIVWRFRGSMPQGSGYDWAPIVSFVDRRDGLYYQYRNHTRRYPAGTDTVRAATDLDQWTRTGPSAE